MVIMIQRFGIARPRFNQVDNIRNDGRCFQLMLRMMAGSFRSSPANLLVAAQFSTRRQQFCLLSPNRCLKNLEGPVTSRSYGEETQMSVSRAHMIASHLYSGSNVVNTKNKEGNSERIERQSRHHFVTFRLHGIKSVKRPTCV